MSTAWTALAVSVLVAVHVSGHRLRLLDRSPRSVWLSAAGGTSVAYVFLHLLPQLAQGQGEVEATSGGLLAWLDQPVHLAALVGLVLFYGLERLAIASRRGGGRAQDRTEAHVFAVHVGIFALYNLLIGYLLVRDEQDDLFFYVVAMALHFLVNDQSLRAHHRERYDHVGRWLLAAALVAGWLLGRAGALPADIAQILVALLAGGVILNVMKEELPQDRESRFLPFAAGAALYGALMLMA